MEASDNGGIFVKAIHAGDLMIKRSGGALSGKHFAK
jgi:hypothetical protein